MGGVGVRRGWAYLCIAVAVHSCAWFTETTTASAAAPERAVICLDAEEPDMSAEGSSAKLFFRELLRQAVLISARDEVGQATRDRVLREDFPDGGKVFAITTSRTKSKYWSLRISAPDNREKILFERRLTVPHAEKGIIDYLGLVVAAEELARTDLKKFWQEQLPDGKPNPMKVDIGVPPEIAKTIEAMNGISQFAALRGLHNLQREQGESPATLGALVRAYAHLGQLTLLHWNASHCVYQSRSLLYSQRWVAREPTSALAMWHRAYAMALAGMHKQALADLESADLLARNSLDKNAAARPEWVDIVDALCRYDAQTLYDTAKNGGKHAELAWLCAYLAVEPGTDADQVRLTTGFEALQGAPECLRIATSMTANAGVAAKHRTTMQGARAVGFAWRPRLLDVPELAANVQQAAGKIPPPPKDFEVFEGSDIVALFEKVPAVTAACVTAGATDRGEPSQAALGRLLEDMAFVEIANRQNFIAGALGLPVDDFSRAALALFPQHSYSAFFAVGPINPQRDAKKYWEELADLDIVDADTSQFALMNRTWNSPHAERMQGENAFKQALQHADHAAYALTFCLQFAKKKSQKVDRAESLTEISPYCPLGITTLIRLDWDKYAQGKEAELENEYADRPIVLAALARGYVKLRRAGDAQRVLEKYLKLSPDAWAYEDLADIYLARGDVKQWQATLDECLNHEDFFLSHAQVQQKIAEHFMREKQWATALEYADAAAQSGAAWALDRALDCQTALKHWDEAEELVKYNSQRYDNQPAKWFYWCRMTGHGNLQESRQLAEQFHDRLRQRPGKQDWFRIGMFKLLDNDKEGAIEALRAESAASANPYPALVAVMLLDKMDRSADRDNLLRSTAEKTSPYRKLMQQLAELFGAAFANGRGQQLDIEKVKTLMEGSPGEMRYEIAMLTAMYLENHGDRAQTIDFYKQSTGGSRWKLATVYGAMRLRELEER